MSPESAEQILRQMLQEAGVDESHSDPSIAWDVYKRFAVIPVDCARDYLFFQVGDVDPDYEFDGYFGFVREFEMRGVKGDEPVWFEQIHIEFQVPKPLQLGVRTVTCFSFDFPDAEAFFASVEKLPEFKVGLEFNKFVLSVYHTGV